MSHIVFYDGECPLCNRVIRFLLPRDKKKCFLFAPLDGETAAQELKQLHLTDPSLDTLVLLQDYQTSNQMLLIEGKGALRIFWLLGGVYRLLGCLSFLPSPLFDYVYRIVAKNRYRLFKTRHPLPPTEERFLP